jgi:hypothetical protein
MTNDIRAWDELRAAGRELAECHGIKYPQVGAIVALVARQFEVPRSPEAEAVNVFLDGLLSAFAEAALMVALAEGARTIGGEQLPDAAQ